MDYIVIETSTIGQLKLKVREYSKEGYQLCGGLAVTVDSVGFRKFYQAMAKIIPAK